MGSLAVLDYLVILVVLGISSIIGLYYRFTGGKQATTREYLLADGDMSVLPVAFSLMASFMSAITLLGVTQEMYSFGTQFVLINLAYIISTPVAAYVFLPVFYKLKSPSVYKYLEARFGVVARTAASLVFSIQMFLYTGIVLYAPSLALAAVTGLGWKVSVLGVGLVCTFYSTLGGIKAVLMTDLFQSLLMYCSVVAVIISTCMTSSVQQVWDGAVEGGRIQFLDTSPDPTVRHTVWTQVFGGCFVYLSLYAVNQAQVQRLLTLPTLRRAQAALWVQVPILMCLSLSTSFAGLCIFYTYKDCDPIAQGRARKSDQLFPIYIADHLTQTAGVGGLVVAGIFSGSLSTVSSAINSLATVTLEDYIRPCYHVPEHRSTLVLKLLATFYGIACIGLAFLADLLGTGVLQASLTVFGIVGGPLLALFTLGMLTRRCEEVGAVTGLVAGLISLSIIGFGGPKPAARKLPVTTSDCSAYSNLTGLAYSNITELAGQIPDPAQNLTLLVNQPVGQAAQPDRPDSGGDVEADQYFYLYRISYAWYSLLGFMVTLLVGLTVSLLYTRISGKTVMVENKLLASPAKRKTTGAETSLHSPSFIFNKECAL